MSSSKGRNETPFAKLLETTLRGEIGHRKVEDIHPLDFEIIIDAIAWRFFNRFSTKEKKLGIESFADYDGIKIEFSKDTQYAAIKKDRSGNFKIIVLPDNSDPEEIKQHRAKEALKEFDCLETVEKYELCLRIFHTFNEPELIQIAHHDPLKRDTTDLEKRLIERAKRRSKTSGDPSDG